MRDKKRDREGQGDVERYLRCREGEGGGMRTDRWTENKRVSVLHLFDHLMSLKELRLRVYELNRLQPSAMRQPAGGAVACGVGHVPGNASGLRTTEGKVLYK